MIAVLTIGAAISAEARAVLPNAHPDVDGPFRTLVGEREGSRVTLYRVEPATADAAWAATRIARRRGAERLLVFAEAWAAPRLLRAGKVSAGSLAEPGACGDGSLLAPWLAAAPRMAGIEGVPPAPELPPPLPLGCAEGLVLRSLSRLPEHPRLADALARQGVADLYDSGAHGALEAAREAGLPVRIGAIIWGPVGHQGAVGPVIQEALLAQALESLEG